MLLKLLKSQKTKLLKSNPQNEEQFEKVQKQLNEVEAKLLIELLEDKED